MVRPKTLMLSVFMTPWQKPTDCHSAIRLAVRSATALTHATIFSCSSKVVSAGKYRCTVSWNSARSCSGLPWWAKCSKCPKRKKEGATRVTTAAVSKLSRRTGVEAPTRAKAREVGIPNPCIASLQRYSRMLLRNTARPSPIREKGVGPAPLSCISKPPIACGYWPRCSARPSPSCPAHTPNWCPL